jgi:hypothetical protein
VDGSSSGLSISLGKDKEPGNDVNVLKSYSDSMVSVKTVNAGIEDLEVAR